MSRDDARILAMSGTELRAECRNQGMDPDRVVAEMDAATKKAILSVLPTGSLFNELVRRLNYDGPDTASLTLGEIERAIDGASLSILHEENK